MAPTLFSRLRSIFCFFVLFRKTVVSTHKHSITKLLSRFCHILTTRFSEIRQQIRVIRELLNQTALKTVLLKKQINITHAVLEFCTGRFVTSAPWESTLRNNFALLLALLVLSQCVGEQTTLHYNRPVQNSKTACVILICSFNKTVFRAVWLRSSRMTRICCLISEKRIVRIRQNLLRSFVIECFMGAHDGFTK